MDDVSGRLRFEHSAITTYEGRRAEGKAARKSMRRSAHSVYTSKPDRDPLGVLTAQNETRLPWLVPLRLERMLQSPFAFYRGSAALQAADLAGQPTTGAGAVLCGDAHIANFGLFASPQRTLVFDLNDFDEAAYGPWEWDVKRFVTSVVIAGRHRGFSKKKIRGAALEAASAYRTALSEMMELDTLERYYRRAEVRLGVSRFGKRSQKVIDAAIKSSERRTSARVLNKITETLDDGTVSIIEQPPTLTHLPPEIEALVADLVETYRRTVSPDIAFLLSQYTVTDAVRRVVGVGSVGTRCFIVVLTGPQGEALVLQVKEAGHSVLNEFGGIEPVEISHGADTFSMDHGFRVVSNQRILQAVSDPFLGYFSVENMGFYVRQFRDRNVSIDVDTLKYGQFRDYINACGQLLARAHSQSPNGAFISGYLGRSDVFDIAIAEWADAYADQSDADFIALREAVQSGGFIPKVRAPAKNAAATVGKMSAEEVRRVTTAAAS